MPRFGRALAGRRQPVRPSPSGARISGPRLGPLVGLLAVVGLLLAPVVGAGAIVLPEADLRITATVEEGPDAGGIDTGSTMRYQVTVRNDGPNPIPASGLLLVLFVDRSDSSQLATIEVARFNDGGGLRPAPGGECGNGRRVLVQCTNRQVLDAGEQINLEIGHRHPTPEAGTLSFVAEASLTQQTINDPVPGNNTYRGPNYRFREQPSTTTTSSTTTTLPTTTTTADTTTTGDPSSTTDPNATSTTVASSTSSSSTTTSTTTTTTTAPTTTSTTEAPTTATESSLAALSGSGTLPAGPTTLVPSADTSNDQAVLGQSGAAPTDGGPPYLVLAALVALVLLLGGVAVAAYAYLNRPPPLVDMRHFE